MKRPEEGIPEQPSFEEAVEILAQIMQRQDFKEVIVAAEEKAMEQISTISEEAEV